LDQETRGFLESLLDEVLISEEESVEDTKKIFGEIIVSSVRDLNVGYLAGVGAATCILVMRMRGERVERKDEDVVHAMIKRRVPEIIAKVENELNR